MRVIDRLDSTPNGKISEFKSASNSVSTSITSLPSEILRIIFLHLFLSKNISREDELLTNYSPVNQLEDIDQIFLRIQLSHSNRKALLSTCKLFRQIVSELIYNVVILSDLYPGNALEKWLLSFPIHQATPPQMFLENVKYLDISMLSLLETVTTSKILTVTDGQIRLLDPKITPKLDLFKFSLPKIEPLSRASLVRLSKIIQTAAVYLNSRNTNNRVSVYLCSHLYLLVALAKKSKLPADFLCHIFCLDIRRSDSDEVISTIPTICIPNLKELSIQPESNTISRKPLYRMAVNQNVDTFPFVVNLESIYPAPEMIIEDLLVSFLDHVCSPVYFKSVGVRNIEFSEWQSITYLHLHGGQEWTERTRVSNFPNLKYLALTGIHYGVMELDCPLVEKIYMEGMRDFLTAHETMRRGCPSLKEVIYLSPCRQIFKSFEKQYNYDTSLFKDYAKNLQKLTIAIVDITVECVDLLEIAKLLPEGLDFRIAMASCSPRAPRPTLLFSKIPRCVEDTFDAQKVVTKVECYPQSPAEVFRDTGLPEWSFVSESKYNIHAFTVDLGYCREMNEMVDACEDE